MKTQYYKIQAKYRQYKGERYFRFEINSDHVIQVCVSEGEIKKGKGHSMGVVIIHANTLLSNYMAPGYLETCSKNKYERAFNKTVKLLKP